MLIWNRTDLTHSIKLVKTGIFDIWLEINKEIISTEKNVLLCATYIPPIESPYFNDDSFSILEGVEKGHVQVCGDLNARTGQEPSAHRGTKTYLEGTTFPPPHVPAWT